MLSSLASPFRRGGPRRRIALFGLAVAAAVITLAVVLGLSSQGDHKRPTHLSLAGFQTALVARRDLVEHNTVSGTLGFTDPENVVNQLSGTVTWLPNAGALVKPGSTLYRVDGKGVFLFDGTTPASRTFEPGMTPGGDVRELEHALSELGYDVSHELTFDATFDWTTRATIERWQQANGMLLTGAIPLGQVVFQPGIRRVGQPQVTVGQAVSPQDVVFQSTSADPIVTGSIDAGDQADLQLKEKVSVDLLDGTIANGTIVEIDRVATTTSGQDQQDTGQGGSSTPSSSSIGFQVRLDNPSVVGRLDQAPVTIDVDAAKATNVLSVPVTALVALPGGGYCVQTIRKGSVLTVRVTPGFYSDDGEVQISGSGIHAGERVITGQ